MNWISANDRLPDQEGKVIAYGHDSWSDDRHVVPAHWSQGYREFFTWEQDSVVTNVTYWMPMPEPPDLSPAQEAGL